MFTGKVVWFNPKKGFGFISWEKNGVQQKDLFIHFSDIESLGFKTLYKNQTVSFSIGSNNRGEPKATDVKIVSN